MSEPCVGTVLKERLPTYRSTRFPGATSSLRETTSSASCARNARAQYERRKPAYQRRLKNNVGVVTRVVPNLPVGELAGMTAHASESAAEDIERSEAIFGLMGERCESKSG